MTSLLPTDSKSSRWAFTAYEEQWSLFIAMPPGVAEWGWQTETCPKTERLHYQGWLRTNTQVRFSQLRKILPGVHLEKAQHWEALKAYCNKTETALSNTKVIQVSQYKTKFQILEYLISEAIEEYGKDFLMELSPEELTNGIINGGNLMITEGHTYVAWILSDPNFKLTIKQSGKALVLALASKKDRQTDRQN
nr:replication associated protein [Lake Sarah-associated circular virus-18]